MDAVLVAVAQSAPQLGVGSLLIAVIVLLMRRESSAEERHAAELDRVNLDHDEEIAELNARIKGLRGDVDELDRALRALRRRDLGVGNEEER